MNIIGAGSLHVCREDEEDEHDLDSIDCWCKPRFLGRAVIHRMKKERALDIVDVPKETITGRDPADENLERVVTGIAYDERMHPDTKRAADKSDKKPLSDRVRGYKNHITSISGHTYVAVKERKWKELISEIATLEAALNEIRKYALHQGDITPEHALHICAVVETALKEEPTP